MSELIGVRFQGEGKRGVDKKKEPVPRMNTKQKNKYWKAYDEEFMNSIKNDPDLYESLQNKRNQMEKWEKLPKCELELCDHQEMNNDDKYPCVPAFVKLNRKSGEPKKKYSEPLESNDDLPAFCNRIRNSEEKMYVSKEGYIFGAKYKEWYDKQDPKDRIL